MPVRRIQTIFPLQLPKFLFLAGISVVLNYGSPAIIKNIWFLYLIYLYLRSNDEALWLAFFLILNDGFAGFFGIRSANIDSIGLIPEFEVAHLYVIAAIYKVYKSKQVVNVFYSGFLALLMIYIIFLFIYGITQGLPDDYNILLRNVRNIFPLFLIFLAPRLLRNLESYERFFSFVFLISIIAFLTQIFSIISGQSPLGLLGIVEVQTTDISITEPWRGFYNVSANLIAFMASLFYLSSKKLVFNRIYLIIVLISVLGTVFLSATRGWILGFGISVIIYFLFVQRINLKRVFVFLFITAGFLYLALLNPTIRLQLNAAINRFSTVESVVQGDISAGGTSSRTTEQSPKVLAVWRERPLIGWGFSDTYYKNQNGHVGNENILLHSGIIGALLMILFFFYFHFKLITSAFAGKGINPYSQSVLVFPVFFLGWFIIHSTSGQHFAYMGSYYLVFSQAIFFGFGSTVYNEIKVLQHDAIRTFQNPEINATRIEGPAVSPS